MILNSGIEINGKHSYRDFDLYISKKVIGLPDKEFITDTVPFMSGYYDFSNLLGQSTFKERQLEYTFDLVATEEKTLEELKTDVAMWLLNVHNANIYDDELANFHFVGSISGCDISEDEDYAEIKVVFTCQPFKIANEETEIVLENGETTIDYIGMNTNIFVVATGNTAIEINNVNVSVGTTKTMLSLPLTTDGLTINYTGNETVTISYIKEVI